MTGVCSFIGRELLKNCDVRGITVTGIDTRDGGRPDCHISDVRNPDIADLIPENIDAVVHLAALSRDPDCRDQGYRCFDNNVMGTLNLMTAAKKRSTKQFIFASSEWVYDNFEKGVAKTEEDCIDISRITSEYALSKLVSEANLRQKYQRGFCPVTILRFGIVYGPRTENWSAVESLLHAVAVEEKITVDSLATARSFIHVSDVADCILASLSLKGFEILNVQGNRPVTLREIIEVGKKFLDRNPSVIERRPNQPSVRLVSRDKVERLLGWQPSVELEEGVKSVIEFLRLDNPKERSVDPAEA